MSKPDWGYYTQKDNIIYAHIFEAPIGPLPLIGLDKDEIAYMTYLHDGSEVTVSNSWVIKAYDKLTFAQIYPGSSTCQLPDDTDTVIKIVLKN